MRDLTFRREKKLKEIQYRYDFSLQANQAAIEVGFKTLNALFLLNGATATALLAQSSEPLKNPAWLFGIGALLAIVALALAYFFSLALADAPTAEPPATPNSPYLGNPLTGKPRVLSEAGMHSFRICVCAAGALSAVAFIFGLVWGASILNQEPAEYVRNEPPRAAPEQLYEPGLGQQGGRTDKGDHPEIPAGNGELPQ